jgi:hypothetical protein
MKSRKSPKTVLKPVKKIRGAEAASDLSEKYQEIRWLRDLVAQMERVARKPERH